MYIGWVDMTIKILLIAVILIIVAVAVVGVVEYMNENDGRVTVTFDRNAVIAPRNTAGKLNGLYIKYANGKIILEQVFINGLANGWATTFYDNGKVKNKTYFKNNKADGVQYHYYEDGKINFTRNWLNNELSGYGYTYYESGVIEVKSFFKDGNKQGIEYTYYPDRKIKFEESFKDDETDGPRTMYYENGQIEQKLVRKNGKDEGTEHGYYEDGKLRYTRNWVDDHLYGGAFYYYKNKQIETYHAYGITGDKFYLSWYDSTGKVTKEQGNVLSLKAFTKFNDSTEVLMVDSSYKSIRDLFVTLANPPKYSTSVMIVINNKLKKKITFPDRNTVFVKNAFVKNGFYDIEISVLLNKHAGPPHEEDYELKITKL